MDKSIATPAPAENSVSIDRGDCFRKQNFKLLINAQEVAVSATGPKTFFRIALEDDQLSVSVNRLSGMYFYRGTVSIGRTRVPGSNHHAWFNDLNNTFRAVAKKSDRIVVMNSSKVVAEMVDQHGTIKISIDGGQEISRLITLWMLGLLRCNDETAKLTDIVRGPKDYNIGVIR